MAKQEKEFVKFITPQKTDFSQWYTDVVLKADLADYAPIRGCIVVKPTGYAIWESITAGLNRRFKKTGVVNAYFPMFIPESLFQKEVDHIEGFAPEVPWVTHVGQEPLPERLAIRPTSEIIIGSMYAKWIQSYRDLPVLINQWCSVVRWEKATRPFLRTAEFLWQEGHTAHRDEKEARERTLLMLDIYRQFFEEDLAIPVLCGEKTESEKFAGAISTYSVEALMGNGMALQAGTSHYLGQGFAEVLDIGFLDSDGQRKHVYQTSWGVSHRSIGALVMVHGDDRGLVLPPKIAPTQIIIVPIMGGKAREQVIAKATELEARLGERFSVRTDLREEYSPGWKFNEWEMRGVPLRLEIGPRDLSQNQVVLVRRDSGEKIAVPEENLVDTVGGLLESIQDSLFAKAKKFMEDNTYRADTLDELIEIVSVKKGMATAGWCGDAACERKIKEETGATIRNIPFGRSLENARCINCGGAAKHSVCFARAF